MSATARGAPDRREVALVAVAERRARAAAQPGAHDAGGVAALLHRHRRERPGARSPPVGVADRDHVADREHLGMTGQREVRVDRRRGPARSTSAPARARPAWRARREATHAGRPDDGARAGSRSCSAVGARHRHAIGARRR